MKSFESKGRTVMNYEFKEEGNILVIKLSGTAEVNDRLLTKESITPYLQKSYPKVIVDLEEVGEKEAVSILGVLNVIKKEFQLMGGEVKLCSLRPSLYRYFKENRLDRIFDIVQPAEQAKRSFKRKSNGI
jgi:anti-anti-sigma factor